MKIVEDQDNENYDLMWADHAVSVNGLIRMKPY
jgi:hypothetical protein